MHYSVPKHKSKWQNNRKIFIFWAQAQLLAQDVENTNMLLKTDGKSGRKSDDELRKMLTDVFIDNASLRKQLNAVIRCTLNSYSKSEEEDEKEEEEQVPVRRTVLSKFL